MLEEGEGGSERPGRLTSGEEGGTEGGRVDGAEDVEGSGGSEGGGTDGGELLEKKKKTEKQQRQRTGITARQPTSSKG